MKVLVVGSGGREHALVWKLSQSARVEKIYCAPGNGGIAALAHCVDLAANDIAGLANFAEQENIDLTIIGPEDPLTGGIVDTFESRDLAVFGPSAAAAELEGSKVFTKDFCKKYNIPSSDYQVFKKAKAAKKYIDKIGAPCVIKADGLAAGKGVIVAHSRQEAKQGVDLIMKEKAFGQAGKTIVVEQFLTGEEVSFIAFTDGETILPLPSSQDHKPAFEGDKGPNTGGMGAYSPAPVLTEALTIRAINEIMLPTIRGMAAEGRPYKGMLYAGLMIDGDEINVLEFNCRFGDPECQPLMMRLKTDLVEIIEAVVAGRLHEIELEIDPGATVCVVMASQGYPGKYPVDKPITGLEAANAQPGVTVFHAGTRQAEEQLLTTGGRVLGVTATGTTIAEAIRRAYAGVNEIQWPGRYYRGDIGHRALERNDNNPLVGILMGSDSDADVMIEAAKFLDKMGICHEITILSAHRTPDQAAEYARTARERGLKTIIAGAGMAAHLAGVLASHTTIPVIGVPLDASSLKGMDALLATVQMPPGIPVATMGIGKAGAKNAAILTTRILSLHDQRLSQALDDFKAEMLVQVEEKNKALLGRLKKG